MFVVAIASLLLITLAAITAYFCFVDPLMVRLLVVLAVWIATAPLSGTPWGRSLKWWELIGICLSIAISVAIMHWPPHLGFRLSQEACDRLATEISLGQNVVMPQRAGLFLVREADVNRHGIVYLCVDSCLGGSMGLTKCGADAVAGEFNLWYTLRLSKDWQVVIED